MAFLIPFIPAIVGAASAVYSGVSAADSQRKALHAQQDAAKASQINIDQLNEQTKTIARQNAVDSTALEKQMTPEVPALRTAANNAVLGGVGTDPGVALGQSYLTSLMDKPVGSQLNPSLLQAAIAKAQENLALGGKLPQDVQNLVTRKALANAGTVAPGSLQLGRDLTTRDLGLTSLNLEQQRLATAGQLGGQQLQLGQANNDVAFNNNAAGLNIVQLLNQLSNNTFSKNLAAAQYGQSIQQPLVGLDPSAAGNIAMNNANNMTAGYTGQANAAGAQANNYMNLFGNSVGSALLAYNNRTPTSSVPSTNPSLIDYTYKGPYQSGPNY